MSFPEDSWVEVRYPLTDEQEHADRAAWPWLPGWVVGQCGPDEWEICVQAPELSRQVEGETVYPVCFRDASELRSPAAETAGRAMTGTPGPDAWMARLSEHKARATTAESITIRGAQAFLEAGDSGGAKAVCSALDPEGTDRAANPYASAYGAAVTHVRNLLATVEAHLEPEAEP